MFLKITILIIILYIAFNFGSKRKAYQIVLQLKKKGYDTNKLGIV